MDTGCSEMCLSKILGNQFDIMSTEFGEELRTNDSGSNMDVKVKVICSGSDEQHEAEITLNITVQNYPWRHWHIIFSTLGGTVAEPWCP